MHTLQQTLLDTPWWVYAIFIYVVYRGIRASQTRVMPLARLFILPLIIVVFADHTLLAMTTLSGALVLNWLITLIIGFLIGWWLTKMRDIKADQEKGWLQISGLWISLLVILLIFGSHYYVGYMTAVHPVVVQRTFFAHIIFAINGITMGIIVGRLVHYLYCYKTQTSVLLEYR